MDDVFRDRRDGGRRLAGDLDRYAGRDDVVVLALPRGGVPVGFEVARGLDAPLDVLVVRKLGVPGHEELAMGAIASGGVSVLNSDVVRRVGFPQERIDEVAERERVELERREHLYRGDRPPVGVEGKTAIVVDDGLATGATMRAAVAALRERGPQRVVVGVPAAARHTCELVGREADDVVCSWMPEPFYAVGMAYRDFGQTTDEEVRELLDSAHTESPSGGEGSVG